MPPELVTEIGLTVGGWGEPGPWGMISHEAQAEDWGWLGFELGYRRDEHLGIRTEIRCRLHELIHHGFPPSRE